MIRELFDPANYFFNPYAVPSLITAAYCLFLGGFVWAKNKKILGFSLFALTFPCGMWMLSVDLGMLSAKPEVAYVWYKFCYFWVSIIAPGSLYFCQQMTRTIKIRAERVFLVWGYVVMVPFAFISLFTDLLVKYPPNKFYWGYEGHAGILLLPYLGAWCVWAFKATINSYLSYKNASTSLERRKFFILFFTYFFGYFAVVDYAGDFGIPVYPAGFIFIAVYISLLAYNMIRYKAFEVETVIHRTALWLLASASIFLPLVLFLYAFRPWLSKLNILVLGLVMMAMFYSFKFYTEQIQPRIDHIFRRKKYDYSQMLGMLSLSLKGVLDMDKLSSKVIAAMKEALYLKKVGIMVRDITTGKIRPLVGEGFSQELPVLSAQDALVSYLRNNAYLERELVEIDPGLASIKESALYSFLKDEEALLVLSLNLDIEFIGCIILGKKENLQPFTGNDIHILTNIASDIALYFYNALHHEDIMEKQRLDEEMRFGREIQMALLPQHIPQVSNLSLRGLMQPAKEIGGDYYDFISIPKRQDLAVVIGDVSGKGVAAGLLMSMVKATIHTLAQDQTSPKEILLRTNQMLYQNIGGQKFMTLIYLLWQSQSKTLVYSSAGHEHILIYHAGAVEAVVSGGFMLGMLPEINNFLEERQIKLEPHDKILLYTDGVTEAMNNEGERFGLKRLADSLQRHGANPADQLMYAIKDEVYAFIGSYPQYDDITLVVLEAQ